METKKAFYNNIFRISKEIELLLQLGKFAKIAELLTEREELLGKIDKKDFKIPEIKEIVDKIKALDEQNFAKMDELKQELSQKMIKLSKNSKLIGSYKQAEIHISRLVDEINS